MGIPPNQVLEYILLEHILATSPEEKASIIEAVLLRK
jgi:hypothetical protein